MLDGLNVLPEGFVFPEGILRLLISTVLLFAVVLLSRALTARFIRRTVVSPELRGRWLVNSRNGFLLLTLLGLVIIWGEELRTLALSIVAIAVAFVVATKELILCLTGSMLKSGSRSFNLGDRIQVKEFRGDVIDQSLLATTVLEVGPGALQQRTGRMIVIPNALFVSEPVINESFTENYGFHVFSIPFRRGDDWRAAQVACLDSANRQCAPYLEQVRDYMTRVSANRGLAVPAVEPRVTLQFPAADTVHLVVRVPVKVGQRSFIEQAVLSEVFTEHDFLPERGCTPVRAQEPAASGGQEDV
ncbi:mechanosensitive ion channel domain-containing protein [Halopseudomonas sp.]|uniref:mechanosensitive ion channel domain-containing protein n=1 Tax=Halopseudomonas sp. TaxID=2901191 RepID=UPI00356B05D8